MELQLQGFDLVCKICQNRFVDGTAHRFHEKWSHQLEDGKTVTNDSNTLKLKELFNLSIVQQSVSNVGLKKQLDELEVVQQGVSNGTLNKQFDSHNPLECLSNGNLIKHLGNLDDVQSVSKVNLSSTFEIKDMDRTHKKKEPRICGKKCKTFQKENNSYENPPKIMEDKHTDKFQNNPNKEDIVQHFNGQSTGKQQCPNCQMNFNEWNKMLIHQKTNHGIINPYKCQLCNKHFPRIHHLNVHMLANHAGLTNAKFVKKNFLVQIVSRDIACLFMKN
jgi:hypothetical protein